jgi:hypothetical protein
MKTVFSILALGALAAPLTAQALTTGEAPIQVVPQYAGTYDVTSDTLIPVAPPPGGTVVFDNTAGNGSFYAPGAGLANMDWGTLSAGGSNSVTSIQIGYASSSTTDVDMIVSLHEGATGFGDAGVISSYSLTGLPGGDPFGGIQAWIIDVTLPGALELPDGAIGWSYEATDDLTGPLTVGPPNEAGVVDAFDQYAGTGGPVLGTFFFGGVPFASFHMQLTAEAECFLVIGDQPGVDGNFMPGSHQWVTQVGDVQEHHAVLLNDIPEFVIPVKGRGGVMGVDPAVGTVGPNGPITADPMPEWMADGEFAVQVVMWNPGVFPQLPEQYTYALYVKINPDGTVLSRPMSQTTGMEVWTQLDTNAQGQPVIRFPFSIPGM